MNNLKDKCIVDKEYCMSAFLRFRIIPDCTNAWTDKVQPIKYTVNNDQTIPVKTVEDVENTIKQVLNEKIDKQTGIMLSGGIDSAILASYMPKGTKAYTMKCVAENAINEVETAQTFADKYGLDLKVVEITWDDMKNSSKILLKNSKQPCHSIEPMIYRVCEEAKKDGINKLVCGESADCRFGGLDGLLSKDWTFDEFVNRYQFLDPNLVLKHPKDILAPFMPYKKDDGIDVYSFLNNYNIPEKSLHGYLNPAYMNNIELILPYVLMKLDIPLDIQRVRNGESKYLLRELFKRRYPDFTANKKLPMPRAVGIWLKDWKGPQHPEFREFDINELKPDQKWLVYILEQFLIMLDNGELND